jgi:hypothetical protein
MKMKRYLVLFVIAFLTMAFRPNTQTVYSMDEYDGSYFSGQQESYASYNGDKPWDTTGSGSESPWWPQKTSDLLWINYGISVKSYSFVTFSLKDIDLSNAKSAKIVLTEKINFNIGANYQNTEITVNLVFVKANSYETNQWQGTSEPEFTWLNKEVQLYRDANSKKWSNQEDILTELQELSTGPEKMVTLVIQVNPGNGWAYSIGFADGDWKNGLQRPKLVITY